MTSGGVTATNTLQTTPSGDQFNYTVVVQIPFPWFNLSLNLQTLANFVLAQLKPLGIPQAMIWLETNGQKLFQNVIDDATALIKAIPGMTVTIQIKLGSAVILNVQLLAVKVPTDIGLPTFQLGLPDFAVNLSYAPPAIPPIVLQIPIPVPIIHPPKIIAITGGTASASGTVGAASTAASSSSGFTTGVTPLTVSPSLASNFSLPKVTVPKIAVPTITDPVVLPKI